MLCRRRRWQRPEQLLAPRPAHARAEPDPDRLHLLAAAPAAAAAADAARADNGGATVWQRVRAAGEAADGAGAEDGAGAHVHAAPPAGDRGQPAQDGEQRGGGRRGGADLLRDRAGLAGEDGEDADPGEEWQELGVAPQTTAGATKCPPNMLLRSCTYIGTF